MRHEDAYGLLRVEVDEEDEEKLWKLVDQDSAGVARRDTRHIEAGGTQSRGNDS